MSERWLRQTAECRRLAGRPSLSRWLLDVKAIESLKPSRAAARLRDRHLQALPELVDGEIDHEALVATRDYLARSAGDINGFALGSDATAQIEHIENRLAVLAQPPAAPRPTAFKPGTAPARPRLAPPAHSPGWSAYWIRPWQRRQRDRQGSGS